MDHPGLIRPSAVRGDHSVAFDTGTAAQPVVKEKAPTLAATSEKTPTPIATLSLDA